MEYRIDMSDVTTKMDNLKRRSPRLFNRVINTVLTVGAHKIKNESIMSAKNEARGVTGGYLRGFRITRIMKDAFGKFIEIYNTELYSMVIERGGHWTKQPPKSVIEGELSEWVKRKLIAPKRRAKRKERVKHSVQTKHGVKAQKAEGAKASRTKNYSSEVKKIAYAVGMSLKKNKYNTKGQKFFGSHLSGKLMIMTRAFRDSRMYIDRQLNIAVDKALGEL